MQVPSYKKQEPISLQEKPYSNNNVIIIPESVEKKFRIYCALSPNLEWSGILFYKADVSKNGIKITCVDFFLMNQGSGADTEIDFDTPEIAGYMAQNPELLDCRQGLCHSHHHMKAWFSEIDKNLLRQEGVLTDNFVSLIVNNEGNYTAVFTQCYNIHTDVTEKQVHTISYSKFGGSTKSRNLTTENEYAKDTKSLEYTPLKIVINPASMDDSLERFNLISGRSYRNVPVWKSPSVNIGNYEERNLFSDLPSNKDVDGFIDYEDVTFNMSYMYGLCDRLIVGTPFPFSKPDYASIERYYTEISSKSEGFDSWLTSWVEYLLYDEIPEWLEQQFPEISIDESAALLAQKLIDMVKRTSLVTYKDKLVSILNDYAV